MLADRFSLLPPEIVTKAQSFRWVMVTLLVLGIAFLWEYEAAETRDLDVTRMYLKANLIWLFLGINSVCLITLGLMVLDMIKNPTNIFSRLLGSDFLTGFLAWNPIEIGIVCLIFCLFWKGREMWLSWCEKNMTGRI